ncbi:hypothetical protein ES708_30329 [subsurface metagenome]
MPESVTDRPTESHEYLLMLTQSGKSLYWTHRDGGGTRVRPKADYRWVKVAPTVRGLKTKGDQELDGQKEQLHGQDIDPNRPTIIEEVAVEPADWKERIICPECGGEGKRKVEVWFDFFVEEKCPECGGKGKIQLWKRINLWKGHDYYWDAEAVREQPLNTAGIREVDEEGYTRYRQPWVGKRPVRTADDKASWASSYGSATHPGGRNIRSVWEFPTQPYPEAHFAVFPEKLPETCIKAATPEAGCCSKCGAPWERILEKKPATMNIRVRDAKRGVATSEEGYKASAEETDSYGKEELGYQKTIGWQPTCNCNADKAPSIVGDFFAGSGTTLWVAKKLGRRAVGYELSEEYCRLTVERNRQQVLL